MKDSSYEQRRKQYQVADETQPAEETGLVIESNEIEGSTTCGECGAHGPGIINTETPVIVYVAILVMIFVIGKWAFLIAPFLFLLVTSQIRTCNSCGHLLESKMQFSFKAVNESVYTMKFSSDLVIVISKRYSMIIGSVVLLLGLSIFTYEEWFAGSSSGGSLFSNLRQICTKKG